MTLNLNGHSVDIFGNHIFYFKYWVYILIYSRPWAIPSPTLTQCWTEFRYPYRFNLPIQFFKLLAQLPGARDPRWQEGHRFHNS